MVLSLAYRNIKGAGLRTWLNVAVLALAYVLIIWHQGFFIGMLKQASDVMISDEIAGGQYWHHTYDPYDPLSYDESHGQIPQGIRELITQGNATPLLIRQAVIYPEGRFQSVVLKGIDPAQTIIKIPSQSLSSTEDELPVLIGRRMANNTRLNVGDYITIRWRDVYGTFDAVEGKVVEIMKTQVPTIDSGKLWIPLEALQEMTQMDNQASVVIVRDSTDIYPQIAGWNFKEQQYLLKEINAVVDSKKSSSRILYGLLLFLAMLAIFDTQVLSVFRRRKEIGTLIALGMTRLQVMCLFTLEGMLHGILALGVAAVVGGPLLVLTATKGIKLPEVTESYGFALTDRMLPSYTIGLIVTTVLTIMVIVTVVSFWPVRKIAHLSPTEALKGKVS